MLRARSTGSQKSSNRSDRTSSNSPPGSLSSSVSSSSRVIQSHSNSTHHTRQQHPAPSLASHLMSRSPRRKSDTSEDTTDDDDDLRSLLSGNSLDKKIRAQNNPHKKRQQKQQQHQQQQEFLRQGSGEGSLSPPNVGLVSSSDENFSGSMNVNVNNNASHGPVPGNTKKKLWLLGTIILAVGLLGPSGLLWDLFEDDDESPSGVSGAGSNKNHFVGMHGVSAAGDKHHHLPQPANWAGGDPDNVHPMLRSHNAIDKASNGRNKFNRREKERRARNKRNNKKKDSGWGIKDAIHNIDKVFLDNHPAATTEVKREVWKNPRSRGNEEDDDGLLALTDDELAAELPIVHADDETLPENAEALDAYTYSLPASDALECRASVVAFVINATDVKDECDGLRKAFDKTCSVHSGPAGGAVPVAPVVDSADQVKQGHRRLSERGRPRLWNLIPAAFERQVQMAGERLRSRMAEKLGEEKRRLQEVRESSRSRPKATIGHHGHTAERKIEEDHDHPEEPDDVAPAQPVQQKQQEHAPPMISLNIPTAEKHISEEVLNDALMLQDSGSEAKPQSVASADAQSPQQPAQAQQTGGAQSRDQPPPPPALPAKPNITAEAAEAVQDAAESAEAIRTAVEGVKNVMNDPKSVEARTCCASILSVFHEHCDPTTTGVEDYSDRRLLVVVFVITVCGMVKSLIRHLNIRWLPEAGGCILVGVFGYLILEHMPHVQFAFDGDMFLRIMVPPIVFEAAVKINKQSFRRHVVPICIFAIVGTLASTAFTAFILNRGSGMLRGVTTIPLRESLIFGALISSIDPIAVLSVLNNMGMTDSDTIYVLIFGESLLNDGVAIVLFQTLVHFLDETLVIDSDVVFDAFMHFLVVAVGSVTVGALSGACSTVYFAMMHGCQTPMVEVIMFCCWSFIPYYICDMVEWSGIVAIVANGFVMDLYVIGQKQQHGQGNGSAVDDEIDFLVNGNSTGRARYRQSQCRQIFSYEGHLSSKADSHVHFVIEIFATLMETAIFAYLGLFLFSPRYHWSGYLTIISISATVLGRVIMIPLFSQVANVLNRMSLSRNSNRSPGSSLTNNNNEGVHIDRRMQLVLVFAGLRGAMSFALVEHIPLFDTTTSQGSRFKPELKAMTSASVIFTVFVLGGATSYLMERLGYSINKPGQNDNVEIVPLVQHEKRKSPAVKRNGMFPTNERKNGVRQRGAR